MKNTVWVAIVAIIGTTATAVVGATSDDRQTTTVCAVVGAVSILSTWGTVLWASRRRDREGQ